MNKAIYVGTPIAAAALAGLPVSHAVSVGNKTFEIQHQLSSAGSVRNVRMDAPSSSIIVTVNVPQDANLTLVIPRKMLEQLEKETKEHYCAGNGFVAFVNATEVYMTQ